MLDPATLTATLAQRSAVLTRREFGVLSLLYEANGATVAHEALLGKVWGANTARANLRVAIAGLRRKLEADPELPASILSVPGQGYRLVPTTTGAPGPTGTGTSSSTRCTAGGENSKPRPYADDETG